MKRKWMPHIIAAAAFVVFIVLGLACASAPKPPKEIVYDTSIPDDQTATLFVRAGSYEVFGFNGIPLNPGWYDPIATGGGTNVKIPAGRHNISFNFYGGGGRDAKNIRLAFNAVAGRNYTIREALVSSGASYSVGYGGTMQFEIFEISQNRELGHNEQSLTVKTDFGLSVDIVIDKGTNDERKFRLYNEIRVIVSKDEEHTIDVEMSPDYIASFGNNVSPTGDSQGRFTASSDPIRYDLKVRGRGTGRNTITTYTLTRR